MSEDKAMIVKMAFLYVQGGEWYKAIEEYKKLQQMDPYDPHIYNMMGDAFAKKNDDKDAFENYLESRELYSKLGNMTKVGAIDKKIAKLNPDRMELKQRQRFLSISKTQEAERLAAEGKLDEAIAFYEQLIAAEPINFSYREKLANLLLDHAMVMEATAHLKAVADFHLSEGRLDQAQEYAGKISLIDPEGTEALGLLATLADRKGDKETASKNFAKLAQVSFDGGSYEMAQKALESALRNGNTELKFLNAKTLMALKKTPEAKQQFEELLKENPADDNILEQLLGLCEEARDWNSAYTHVTTLISRRPQEPKLQPRLARILLQVGKRAEALQIYLNLANENLKENKVEAAFTYFDSILALEPDNVDVLKKKAEIYLKLGKKQEVIETYKKLFNAYTVKKMAEDARKVSLILTKLSTLK